MSTTAGTAGIALVTGAAHGIFRAAALRLARDGREVVVHGRSAGRGAEVVAAVEAEGVRARFAAELMDTGGVRRLAEETGEVDVLVNNVGGPPCPSGAHGPATPTCATTAPPAHGGHFAAYEAPASSPPKCAQGSALSHGPRFVRGAPGHGASQQPLPNCRTRASNSRRTKSWVDPVTQTD
jgi:short chain dehydrogenase